VDATTKGNRFGVIHPVEQQKRRIPTCPPALMELIAGHSPTTARAAEAICGSYCVKYQVMTPNTAITDTITSNIVTLLDFSAGA